MLKNTVYTKHQQLQLKQLTNFPQVKTIIPMTDQSLLINTALPKTSCLRYRIYAATEDAGRQTRRYRYVQTPTAKERQRRIADHFPCAIVILCVLEEEIPDLMLLMSRVCYTDTTRELEVPPGELGCLT